MKSFTATVLACLLLAGGCGKKSKPIPPEQRLRMQEVREQIQKILAEKYHEPIPAATAAQLKRGGELYPQLCAGCHGARGDGVGDHPDGLLQQPTDFTDPEQATFFSEQARLYVIRKGVAGTAMMGWEEVLPESDILAIYVYVRAFSQ